MNVAQTILLTMVVIGYCIVGFVLLHNYLTNENNTDINGSRNTL